MIQHAASFVRLLLGVATLNSVAAADPEAEQADPKAAAEVPAILSGEATRIDGTKEKLEKYAGRVVLVVNTASRCGFTGQYKGLEALYDELRGEKDEKGLPEDFVILGFPSNDFGGQEPGTNEQIVQFCETRFDVSFPMFEKTPVTGKKAHAVYKRLNALPKPIGEPPTWNFTKYLIGRDGKAIARFGSRVGPGDDRLKEMIAKAIEAPKPEKAEDDAAAEPAAESGEGAGEASPAAASV